ncbi:heparan-alpha-glucosaminide N-acetyltransferase (plasmid) [Acuticoccus sp. MNP-M23]|uniref:heparan-alpha-glucosaminide N-acetyltransferase n=1 Tax=Acuticoccus sp. MNP-M23 TaxID=3072793 RepID=UPI0028152DD0|nr:heparan-alpha-glucosaminide N-acetyltransferase [Acuticoccus sp. MNP-M23]WMS45201.1 heparan-alpha-glucosaminide N-acetyltransferase [Acuticoccus sp. MNP-M23]
MDERRTPAAGRLIVIDAVRGLAITGVVLFHVVWDLDLYDYIPAGLATHPVWVGFGRTLAATFMALVGVGLVLAHHRGVRLRGFAKRLLAIAVAAFAVTAATLLAFPDAFVYFGILHAIAVASLLGALMLRLDPASLAQLAIFVILLGVAGSFDGFNTRWLAWIGFSYSAPPSLDFVPLFPWFGATLLGMSAAKRGAAHALERIFWNFRKTHFVQRLSLAGRHSLAIYLIHQPVLLGSIEVARLLSS